MDRTPDVMIDIKQKFASNKTYKHTHNAERGTKCAYYVKKLSFYPLKNDGK